MEPHGQLSRREFLAQGTLGLTLTLADLTELHAASPPPQKPALNRRRSPSQPPKWPEEVYRRFSVDIHVDDWDPALLSQFDAERYVGLMARAGVQSLVQYTNSHMGLCLWPTKIGQRHANLGGRDFFGEVVAVCRRRGIHPLGYFSVIHDNWAYETHEDWRVRFYEGGGPTGRYGFVCPNSPYRNYVFACLEEICSQYEIAGMFFDMTFFPGVCYCPHCEKRFREEENGAPLPHMVDWDDPAWRRFQSARERWLIDFAGACTDTAKKTRPGITVSHQFSTIFHSWAYAVPMDLAQVCDFVGGDFYGGPAQHSLACKAFQGLTRTRPFEFHTSRTRIYTDHVTVKPMEELRMESFVATLHSAALLLVDYINVDGTLNPQVYEHLGKLSRERAPYEPFLGGELLADAALYFDKNSLYNPDEQKVPVNQRKATNQIPHRDAVAGAARVFQEAHIPFGVITNFNLEQLNRYRAVFLPYILEMTAGQAEQFRRFVAEGGVLYASGPTSLDRFHPEKPRFLLEDVFGVRHVGRLGTTVTYLTPSDPALEKSIYPQDHVSHDSYMVQAEALPGAQVLARITLPFADPSAKTIGTKFAAIHSNPPALHPTDHPAVVLNRYGKGAAIWTAAPFEIRNEHTNFELVHQLLRRVLPNNLVFELEAHPSVEATVFLQEEKKRLLVGLLNMQQKLPQVPVPAVIKVRLPEGTKPRRTLRLPDLNRIRTLWTAPYLRIELAPFPTFALFAVDYR